MNNKKSTVLLSHDSETGNIEVKASGSTIEIIATVSALVESLFDGICHSEEEKQVVAYSFGSYFTNQYPPSIRLQHQVEQVIAKHTDINY